MFVVFDLDGTLALNKHREHFLQLTNGRHIKDWDAFHEACYKDTLNLPLYRVLCALEATGHRIEIWSGRSNDVLSMTKRWLSWHNLDHFPYKGRPENDHSSDVILKHGWLTEAKEGWPELMFEDRARVVNMWRALGITCFQVAKGDF